MVDLMMSWQVDLMVEHTFLEVHHRVHLSELSKVRKKVTKKMCLTLNLMVHLRVHLLV